MTMEDLQGADCADPEAPGGDPVLAGRRVPRQNLLDAQKGGGFADGFWAGFPPVKRRPARAIVQLKMTATAGHAHSL